MQDKPENTEHYSKYRIHLTPPWPDKPSRESWTEYATDSVQAREAFCRRREYPRDWVQVTWVDFV